MGRIQILSDELANKIAAGEVVERPASVVKELVENSLDAGATELRVAVEAGGRRLIRVADNGHGMLRDDAMLAFERHATSKIRHVRDLFSIATLGFRGEALPSIASVSRLTLETRSAEEHTGSIVEVNGAKIVKYEEHVFPPGTTVSVRDLFFNVPARRKFLRSEQTELAHIASLVTHYSLAHPDKGWELRHNGAGLLTAPPVTLLRERVYQVFGDRLLEDLLELGPSQREAPTEEGAVRYQLRGFVSRPQVQKSNRNSIFLFVNRRLIRDKLLLHALSSAYHNLIPPGTWPFALLFLDCDPTEVDVNVHPAKTEVRFQRGSWVHDFVRDAIRESLLRSRPASSVPARQSPQPAAALPYSEFTETLDREQVEAATAEFLRPLTAEEEAALPRFGLKPQQVMEPAPRLDFQAGEIPVERALQKFRLKVPETHGSFPAEAFVDAPASMEALRDLRPLGQLHDSFVIAAGRDGLWIIDQHVAHERILFEKVLREWASGSAASQQLLLPLIVDLTPAQWIEYERIADELMRAGFAAERFGQRTLAVQSVPAAIGAQDAERVLAEILEIAEEELRNVSADDLRRAMAATIACRAAIKINTRLDASKIEYLLRELAATEYPMSCPHGRPVALRYGMRDILKSFHRI